MHLWVNGNLGEVRNIFQRPEDAAAPHDSLFKIEVCLLSIGEYKMQNIALKMGDINYSGKHDYLVLLLKRFNLMKRPIFIQQLPVSQQFLLMNRRPFQHIEIARLGNCPFKIIIGSMLTCISRSP